MSETEEEPGVVGAGGTAGALLRAAREAQGLDMGALALTLKVAPRKLEALENDQYGEGQDATFVRALAQAACRVLKLDPAPILAKLPLPDQAALGQVRGGLNAPFRERGMKRDPSEPWLAHRGTLVSVVMLVVAAAAMWGIPRDTWTEWRAVLAGPSAAASAPAVTVAEPVEAQAPNAGGAPQVAPPAAGLASQAQAVAASAAPRPSESAPVAAVPAVASAPVVSVAASGAPAVKPAAAVAESIQLSVREASWVEVVESGGKVLLGRTLLPGEALSLEGAAPLKVKVGNVRGTELRWRGQPVDLLAQARDNVARLELR